MKLFQREQRSLFGEILDWMLTPLMLLLPVGLSLTWLVAQSIAGRPFDRALEYNTRVIAQLVTFRDGRAQLNLPQPVREILRADESDLVYYQVIGNRGEVISGERDLPAPPLADPDSPSRGQTQLRDDEMRGQDVRVAWLWMRSDFGEHPPVLVQVAETREKRAVLATEIIKGVLLPMLLLLPLAVLMVWLALVRGIRPLSELEARIRARKPDDLSPLEEWSVPLEVAPLVSSVNDLLKRLKDSIATQKRFLADAAHQLKTPLAGLRMQADLAQRQGSSASELKQSLNQIERASIRATHTVNQLLALARAESRGSALALQLCDFAQLTLEVVQDSVPRAIDRQIDLGYDGARPGSAGVLVNGNPTLLRELVRNLVDNALNYTPSSGAVPGVVTVRVLPDRPNRQLLLQVEDSGPGIPEADREAVFQPFFRLLEGGAEGSGLGLTIVREIAARHAAAVRIEDAQPGAPAPGTRVSVQFETVAPNGA